MIKRTIHLGSPCRLNVKDAQLRIKYSHVKGQEGILDKKVPIEDIAYLVLEHPQISITHPTLTALLAHKAVLISCNDKMMPMGMMLNLDSHDVQQEHFRYQINASTPLKKQLWQQTIEYKILNQAAHLEYWDVPHQNLLTLAKHVRSGDTDNREAVASYYYWGHLFPASWEFSRKREGRAPNNLLNYGYTILRAITARALSGSGLLPTLGIFHKNRYNAYALADDVMEPYRPFVDFIVRSIVSRTSHVSELNKELKAELLNLPIQDVIINNKKRPLMIAMQETCASLVRCLRKDSRKITYPTFYANK